MVALSLVPLVMQSLELLGCALEIPALPAPGGICGSTKVGEGRGCQGHGLEHRCSFCLNVSQVPGGSS